METTLFKLHNNLILSKFKKNEDINELSLKIFFKCIFTYKDFEQDFFKNEVQITDLVKSNNYKEIKKSIVNLKSQVLVINEDTKRKSFEAISIFETLKYKNGFLTFDFDNRIKDFILDLQSNYTIVDIENITKLNSYYSIKLYLLLKKDIYFNKKNYLIEELYNYLDLTDYYREYKNFKRRILIKSMEDIHRNTTLNIKEIVENKIGRKVNNLIIEREEKEIDLKSFINFLKENFKHRILFTHKPTKTEYYLNEKGLMTKDSLVVPKEESIDIYKFLYKNKEHYLKQIDIK